MLKETSYPTGTVKPLEPESYYDTSSPELRKIAAKQTLAKWRHLGKGPSYIKVGSKVLYKGSDALQWLESQKIRTLDHE